MNTFEEIAKAMEEDKELDISLDIKQDLGFNEAMDFVSRIVSSCYNEETGEYMPEAYDFVSRYMVVIFYGGVTEFEDVDANMEKVYDVLYKTDVYETIVAEIDEAQYKALLDAASKKIKYYVDMELATASKKMQEVLDKIDAMTTASEGVFNEINSAPFQDMIKRISNSDGNITDISKHLAEKRVQEPKEAVKRVSVPVKQPMDHKKKAKPRARSRAVEE